MSGGHNWEDALVILPWKQCGRVLVVLRIEGKSSIEVAEWDAETELWNTEASWSGAVGKKHVSHWMRLPMLPEHFK